MCAFLLFIPAALVAHRLPKRFNKLAVVCCALGCVAAIGSVIVLLLVPTPTQLLMLVTVILAALYGWSGYRFFRHCTRQAVLVA
jgi:ABC-type Mn2+/Zn2+ transport system permease subunit